MAEPRWTYYCVVHDDVHDQKEIPAYRGVVPWIPKLGSIISCLQYAGSRQIPLISCPLCKQPAEPWRQLLQLDIPEDSLADAILLLKAHLSHHCSGLR